MKRLLVFVFAVTLLGSCKKDIEGCTDPMANNYDSDANIDDGSCIYSMTRIPDTAFERQLIIQGYDNVIDGQVLTSNVNNITFLDVYNKSISDLTGIEDFTALTNLWCDGNQLTSLDVSQNTALTELICRDNQLTSLDVSGCNALTTLDCQVNQLTNLDVSQNTALTILICFTNQLTSLDVSQNTALTGLYCGSNMLTGIDVSQNTALTVLNCWYNQLTCLNLKNGNNQNLNINTINNNLTCIEVDDPAWASQNWWNIDIGVTFSTNCNYPAGCF